MRRLLGGIAGIAATRLELLLIEVERERRRLAVLWLCAALTLLLMFSALWLGVTALLFGLAPEQRAPAAACVALVFLLAAALAAVGWLRQVRARRSVSRLWPVAQGGLAHRPQPCSGCAAAGDRAASHPTTSAPQRQGP